MKLRFYAKGDALLPVPGQGLIHGAVLNYVGRQQEKRDTEFKDQQGNVIQQSAYPATQDAFECDSASEAAQLIKRDLLVGSRMGDAPLYCADTQTADFCGVSFVAVEFKDGAWAEKPEKVKATK